MKNLRISPLLLLAFPLLCFSPEAGSRRWLYAHFGCLLERVDGVHRRPGGVPNGSRALPADGPEPEGELVLGGGCGDLDAHWVPLFVVFVLFGRVPEPLGEGVSA